MLQIIITDPCGKRKSQFVDNGIYSIGRNFLADFRLSDKSVGKQRLECRVENDNCTMTGARLDDTFLFNGVETSEISSFLPGDVIEIGGTRIEIKTSSSNMVEPKDEEVPTQFSLIEDAFGATNEGTDTTSKFPDSEGYARRIEIRRSIQEQVQKQLDLYQREKINGMDQEHLRQEALRLAQEVITTRQVSIPADIEHQLLLQEVVSESIGLGPLEPLLEDPSVTEVMVNGASRVYVERGGCLEDSGVQFINERSLMAVIERIVNPLGRRIDEGSPLVDARLPDGSRVNAIIPPLSLVGPVITIRKFSKERLYMDSLVSMGSLSHEMAAFLTFCVEQKKNMIVSGGTGSGKTTFLNALSDAISEQERIVTIEDAAELKLNQQHVISLESRPQNVEGNGQVTIRELVKNSLRMRPDRIIVGECRDGAALDMLQAMNTGHDGSLTTGHANSPRDLLSRLEVMCLMSDIDLPSRALREQISSAVDIIVQQSRFKDGSRRVTSIVEVCGIDDGVIQLNELFAFHQQGVDETNRIKGHFTGLNQSPVFYDELEQSGIRPDRSLFARTAPLHGQVA